MKTSSRLGLALGLLTLGSGLFGAPIDDARHMLVFGRPGSTSANQDLDKLRKQLQSDSEAAAFAWAQAWRDSFGTEPQPGNAPKKDGERLTYIEHMKANLGRLTAEPSLRETVINRAYRYLLQRDAYPEEIKYWTVRPVAPFSTVVASMEHWARRNQPGLMVTSGTPTVAAYSRYLSTVTLSRADALTLRKQFGLEPDGDPEVIASRGHNLIGVAPEAAVTGGHMFFAATGNWDNPLLRED